MKRFYQLILGGVVVCIFLASQIRAQELPKAEDILDKFLQATGGKEAYAKIKNRVSKGKVGLAGIEGTITVVQAAPNLLHTEMNIEGVGKFQSGSNGAVVWELNPITGGRVKDGKEKTLSLRTAQFNSDLDWRKVYKKVECVGEEKVEGKAAYKIEATTPEGDVLTKYYDKETHLAIKVVMTIDNPMGKIPTATVVSDYKKVDGILQPHRLVTTALSTEITIVLTKVEQNVTLPANQFELPPEIKKKVDKQK